MFASKVSQKREQKPARMPASWVLTTLLISIAAPAEILAQPTEVRVLGKDGLVNVSFTGTETSTFDIFIAAEPGVGADNFDQLAAGRAVLNVASGVTIRGLDNNRDYFFRVVENAGGTSASADEVVATPRTPWLQALGETRFVSLAAHPSSPGILLAAGAALTGCGAGKVAGCDVYRSTNSGVTWAVVTQTIGDLDPRAVGMSTGSAIALSRNVGAGEKVLRSTNSGETWALSDTGLQTNLLVNKAIAYGVSNPSVVVVANIDLGRVALESRVIRSENDGMVWAHLAEAPLGQINAQVLAVDPSNDNVIWAGGGGNPLLARSDNGGASWTAVPTQGANPVVGIAIHPGDSSRVWVADTLDVRRSIDGGTSFFASRQGLPALVNINAFVRDQSTDTIFVGTTSGVFESRDDGATFTPLSSGIDAISILDLAIVESPRAMVVASVTGLHRLDLVRPGPVPSDPDAGPDAGVGSAPSSGCSCASAGVIGRGQLPGNLPTVVLLIVAAIVARRQFRGVQS